MARVHSLDSERHGNSLYRYTNAARVARCARCVQALNTLDSRLKENDAVIFIDRKGRRYLKILRAGKKLLIRGEIRADELFCVEEGSRRKFSTGEAFRVLRPTYPDLLAPLPRASPLTYP